MLLSQYAELKNIDSRHVEGGFVQIADWKWSNGEAGLDHQANRARSNAVLPSLLRADGSAQCVSKTADVIARIASVTFDLLSLAPVSRQGQWTCRRQLSR